VVLLKIYHYHYRRHRKKTRNNSPTNGCMTSAKNFHDQGLKQKAKKNVPPYLVAFVGRVHLLKEWEKGN
jgi:hypothetical protein